MERVQRLVFKHTTVTGRRSLVGSDDGSMYSLLPGETRGFGPQTPGPAAAYICGQAARKWPHIKRL